MRLGIGLPTWQGNAIRPGEVLAWAMRAEELGFHAVSVHDQPAHETWEPLVSLAAVASVTERIRLATAAVLLPTRDEALLAKQAAVVDRLSGGRLDLGLGVGAREPDFEVLGRPFHRRGREFERQLVRLTDLWAAAVEGEETGRGLGPAPAQRPRPRLWVGGYAEAASRRAVELGDAYLFGAAGVDAMRAKVPSIRALADSAGRRDFQVGGLAYVLPSADPADRADAERLLVRYYGSLRRPFAELVHAGDDAAVRAAVMAYRDAGLDLLHLIPVGRSSQLIDRLAGLVRAVA